MYLHIGKYILLRWQQAETNNMEDNKLLQAFERIDQLNSESKPLFGKMNVHQMICHCTDFYRMANGTKKANEYGKLAPSEVVKIVKSGKRRNPAD